MRKTSKLWKKMTSTVMTGTILVSMVPATSAQAATKEDKQAFREEIIQMLETGDNTVHDVRKYNLTFSDYNPIFWDITENECKISYNCYVNQVIQTKNDGKYADMLWLYNSDAGFPERYKKMKASIAEIQSGLNEAMNDLEKTLYIHDYIVKHTYYKKDAEKLAWSAGGPLGLGYGVCDGYTKALMLLLELEGIECKKVLNDRGTHDWVSVKIDGEWYHVDPTWDDTRSSVTGKVSHNFFLRNDNEFKYATTNSHGSFSGGDVSSSRKYEDWYVHEIVGDMWYYNGDWYYGENGSIVKNNIEGNERELVVSGSNLEIKSLEEGVLVYSENGKEYAINVGAVTAFPTQEPKPPVQPTFMPDNVTNGGLPLEEYTELECIEVLGYCNSKYFSTGLKMKNDYAFEMKLELTNKNSYGNFFNYKKNEGDRFHIRQEAGKGLYVGYSWYKEKVMDSSVGKPIVYYKEKEKMYINGALVKKGPAMEFELGQELLFGSGKGKIYYFKVWNEYGELIRNYIPVLDKAGNVCMYETVAGEYVYYNGSGLRCE